MRTPKTAAQADLHVAALSERLFLDDDDKDVSVELADGCERAHKAVLNAASDVFKNMFKHSMTETRSNVIKLPDITKPVMRVFLRLLYTGRVDPSDWAGAGEASRDDQLVLKQTKVKTQGRRLTSRRQCKDASGYYKCAAALLAGGCAGDFEFVARSEDWECIALGVAPKSSSIDDLADENVENVCWVDNGYLQCGQDEDGDHDLKVPDGAELTVKLQNCVLQFAVNGGHFAKFDVYGPTEANVEHAPLIVFHGPGQTVDILSVTPSSPQCPVALLIGATLLAKKYMVTQVLEMCTFVLKERLVAAGKEKDVPTFEEIWVAAISGDMFSLRVVAQQAAKDGFAELRSAHRKGSLHPAVSQDLQDVWPSRPAKQRRTTAHLS